MAETVVFGIIEKMIDEVCGDKDLKLRYMHRLDFEPSNTDLQECPKCLRFDGNYTHSYGKAFDCDCNVGKLEHKMASTDIRNQARDRTFRQAGSYESSDEEVLEVIELSESPEKLSLIDTGMCGGDHQLGNGEKVLKNQFPAKKRKNWGAKIIHFFKGEKKENK